MTCPYCGFRFRVLLANEAIPADVVAPIVCESCAEVGLLENGTPRRLVDGERAALRESPAWKDFIEPALEVINRERSKRA